MRLVRATPALSILCLSLTVSVAGCGLFSSSSPEATLSQPSEETEDQDPAAALPKCRPPEAEVKRGPMPFKASEATAGGWTVQSIDDENLEFIRVAFSKDAIETMVEIAYNQGEASDWSTTSYRLMPAPDHEPPPDLLQEVMATLKTWQAAHEDDPFVKKREGIVDPYDGLPPCDADGKPM
jgi:hypothetical protein